MARRRVSSNNTEATRRSAVVQRYRSAVLLGDVGGARRALDEGLDLEVSAEALVEMIGAVQREIGEGWQSGRVSIAEEHRTTEIAVAALERVRVSRTRLTASSRRALVCAAPGEEHTIAARMIAVLLECGGWAVDFLGKTPPGTGLAEHVAASGPELVAISVSMRSNLQPLAVVCRELRELVPRPRIVVGGAAAAGVSAETLGADAIETGAAGGLGWATGEGRYPAFDDYLAAVGRRIFDRRQARGLSQAALAELAGLTRPYVGAVERGVQNFTLDAALRLARALDLTTTELLAQERS